MKSFRDLKYVERYGDFFFIETALNTTVANTDLLLITQRKGYTIRLV